MNKTSAAGMILFSISVAIVLSILTGCGPLSDKHDISHGGAKAIYAARAADEMAAGPETLSAHEKPGPEPGKDAKQIPGERKIITTADISMEVKSIETAYQQLTAMATRSGGYVSDSSYSVGYDNAKSGNITLRVPQPGYEAIISSLKTIGVVESENISGNDVTEEYVDLKARLENKKRVELRFTEILDSAKNITEILEVEKELAQVREEVERLTGRINYLANMTSLATITLTIHEPYGTAPERTPDKWIASKVFKSAWKSFHESATSILTAIIWLLVYSPIIIFFIIALKGVATIVKILRGRK